MAKEIELIQQAWDNRELVKKEEVKQAIIEYRG